MKALIYERALALGLVVSRYEENAMGSGMPAYFFRAPCGREEVFMFSHADAAPSAAVDADLRKFCTTQTKH